jgi:hypothetical protein
MFLRIVYSVFIGILTATFVGVGIAAFYIAPKQPEFPAALSYPKVSPTEEATISAQQIQQQEEFNRQQQEFSRVNKLYNRNVSIIALAAAVLILIASLTLFKTILLIADGLLLGGVLTLLYSIGRGFGTDDNMFRFIVVAIGLLISIVLGYIKFIKPAK